MSNSTSFLPIHAVPDQCQGYLSKIQSTALLKFKRLLLCSNYPRSPSDGSTIEVHLLPADLVLELSIDVAGASARAWRLLLGGLALLPDLLLVDKRSIDGDGFLWRINGLQLIEKALPSRFPGCRRCGRCCGGDGAALALLGLCLGTSHDVGVCCVCGCHCECCGCCLVCYIRDVNWYDNLELLIV